MTAMIFQVLTLLDENRISYLIARTRPDGLTLVATLVGRRLEIFVDECDGVNVSVFVGDESVQVGMQALQAVLVEE
jgi:hypothetical protein